MEYLIKGNGQFRGSGCVVDGCPVNIACVVVGCGVNTSPCGVNACGVKTRG